MKYQLTRILAIAALLGAAVAVAYQAPPAQSTWTTATANNWSKRNGWLVGSNYIPAYAINELEMWQAASFDTKRIDLELGWAQGLGMNTMRVFLHDLLWSEDSAGFRKRLDTFLRICHRHKIKPLLVLFDSCWDPFPKLGAQRAPRPGVHNSGWVQSPGAEALADRTQYPRLEAYVKGVVGAFGHDNRVLGWDIWNEPDNPNGSSYGKDEPKNKVELVLGLLPQAFAWARATHPVQPLTSGVWRGDWSDPARLEPMAKEQLQLSDVISFHNYESPESFAKHIVWLQQYGRPIICTEYMARPVNSTFEGILPVAKQYGVGVMNWGFVQGKTQTNLPWDSWQNPYVDHQPKVWFHDIFETNGKAYRPEETALIRNMTGAAKRP